eukprot:3460304-Prymnesium_polylepis.1
MLAAAFARRVNSHSGRASPVHTVHRSFSDCTCVCHVCVRRVMSPISVATLQLYDRTSPVSFVRWDRRDDPRRVVTILFGQVCTDRKE